MLHMTSVIVDYAFCMLYVMCYMYVKCVSNFLYSTGASQTSQSPGKLTPYSSSQRAWVHLTTR